MATIKLTISAENGQAIAALKQLAGTASETGNSVKSAGQGGGEALNQAAGSATSLSRKLADVTIVTGGIIMVLNKVKEAFKALVAPGIEFGKQMEISKLGVAGVLMSMTKLNGQALKLPDSLAISGKAMDELADASGRIGLPLNELSETFQSIVGAGLTQKMTMQEIVDFTITGTKAVKTMMTGVGNEGMQVIQELRSMVSGNIDQNSQVARSLGITNADIEKAKQSAGGLFAYLQEKLSGFAEIVKVYPDTLKGKMDRLTTVFQQVSSKGAEPFTELLKQGLDAITEQLLVTETHVSETGETLKTVKLNPELISKFKEVSTYLAGLLRDGIQFSTTLANLASGPASLLLSVIKLILDNTSQVLFTLIAWFGIQKAIAIFRSILAQIIAIEVAANASGRAMTRMEAATILVGRAMKSVLITTGWGILAIAIGEAADQAFKLYENLSKAGKTKKDYFKEKEAGMRPIPEQLEGKLSQPVYNVNPEVDIGGMNQQAILRLEKFIAAINYMFPDRAVTVTSGFRKWGGHVNGAKADIDVQGMDEPFFRQQLISLGKEFGIAILDEVEKPASDTPEARKNWGPHLDLDMSGEGLDTPGKGNLTLRNPKDEAEAIAKAKIALAEATEKQELQAYLDGLKDKQTLLDQRLQATKTNTVSDELPAISEKDYYKETALNRAAQAEAEIKILESQIEHLKNLASNNNLSGAEDPINLQAQIVGKQTEIIQKRSELEQSLKQLGFEENQAQKELQDKVTEMQAQLLEAQGKTADAARLRNEKDKQALITELKANGQTGAVDAVSEIYKSKQMHADFSQEQQNLENANGQLATVQEGLLNEYASGTKTAAEATDAYVKQYRAKTDKIVVELQRIINNPDVDAGLSNQAKALLRQIVKSVNDFADAGIQKINTDLQNEIAMINADRNLTSRQKQDLIDAANRRAAGNQAQFQEKTAAALRTMSADKKKQFSAENDGIDPDVLAAVLEKSAATNRRLAETPTLLENIHRASKQAFEDGLLEFLERGILECKSLGDAFRNLAITVLQSIQKVYAEAMTKNIMSLLGMGTGTRPTINGVQVQGPLKPDGSFAEGGDLDSGEVKGPGTTTSDSILAWVSNLGKFIRISNGEFVMRGAAVAKYGKAFLHRINSGLVPKGMLPAFATGGALTDRIGDIPGPQDLTTNLSSDTTIPLSIMNFVDPALIERALKTRSGKKVILNHIKDEAGTIRQILKIKG